MSRLTPKHSGCFFLILFLVGLGGTILFGYLMIWPPLQANLFFTETTCIVLDKRLGTQGSSSRPEIHIEYAANGAVHRTWTYDAVGIYTNLDAANRRTLARFQVGQRYPCWFDPEKPDRAVLTRSFSWFCLIWTIPLTYLAVGAGGLMSKRPPDPAPTLPTPSAIGWGSVGVFFGGLLATAALSIALIFPLGGLRAPFWLTKLIFFAPFGVYLVLFIVFIRRRAARFRLLMPSPERAAVQPEGGAKEEWPTIPMSDLLSGRSLRYLLSSNSSPGWTLVALLAIAFFWNGIVSLFLADMIEGHLGGKPDWCLTAFLVPFVLIGLGLIAAVFGAGVRLGASLLVGKLRVEISDHPLRAGRTYEFVVEQSGVLRLKRVRLMLTCTESATYTAGTSTSTDTKEVMKEEVAQADAMPSDGLCGMLIVPSDGMHSFAAPHNDITWKLNLAARVAGVLPFADEYIVIVLPASDGATP